jgi:hypothetical protein
MGNGYSHEEELLKAYYRHMKKNNPNLVIRGGSEKEVLGGYSSLEEYGNSVYSKSKEELIKGLAKDVGGLLGLKDSSGSIEQIIKKFKEVLPKPGSGKGSLRADSSKHAKLCKLLAKSFNKRFGMVIINEDAETHLICQRVAELMYSLFTGLHSEFLTIAGDVSRIVKNLEVLQGIVDSANQKIMNDLAKSSDDAVSSDAENTKALYKKLSDEIKRQHVMLSNLINSSIGPVGSSLITILADNKDFTGLVEDLKKSTGVQYFGDKLSFLLTGISDVAHSAHLVDKALKKIGMSVSDYKNVKGLNDLRNKVYGAISKKRPSSQELHKLLLAADILYRNDLAHDDIASHLSKKGGFIGGDPISMEPSESSFADMVDDATWNDPTASPFSGRTQSYRTSIGKQLKDQRKYRNMLFTDFNVQIKTSYKNIIALIGKISQKVGNEIPTSPKLEKFIRLLVSFSAIQPDKKNLHIALSGFRSDSTSNYVKYQFLDYLDMIKEEADNLSSDSGGMYFKELSNAFGVLIRIIDDFNINFTKTLSELHIQDRSYKGGEREDNIDDDVVFGGGKRNKKNKTVKLSEEQPEPEPEPEEIKLNVVDEEPKEVEHNELQIENNAEDELQMQNTMLKSEKQSDSSIGGFNELMSDVLGGIIRELPSDHFKQFMTLKKAIREMDYYYRISNIKSNLRKMSVENKENVANYENILGEEAGWMIDQINRKYEAIMASLNGGTYPAGYSDEESVWKNGYTAAPDIVVGGNDGSQNVLRTNLKTAFSSPGLNTDAGNASEYSNENSGVKAGYKFLIEYIRTAKIEMLEAAQSIDLYLSKFTQNIEQDVDTIKSFVEIIEQLEIVAKWFTDKSGDNLVGVFEAFNKDNVDITNYQLNDANINADGGYELHYNPIGNFNNPLTTEYTLPSHYYTEVKDRYNNIGKFYKPRLMTRNQAIQFVKQLEKSIKSVRALENIINLFNKINVQSSGEIKTFMNVGMLFKAFTKYCVASVIGLGFRIIETNNNQNVPNNVDTPVINYNVNAEIKSNAMSSLLVKTGVTLRFSNTYIKLSANRALQLCDPFEFQDDIKTQSSITDRIFEMCIKSMVSKIFVIVGSYSLFHRPPKNSLLFKAINSSFSVNPLRQIIGGNANQTGGEEGGRAPIQVITEALDLYIRLPPLIEWYRKVFQFNYHNPLTSDEKMDYRNQNDPIVSFIPEMDNIWRDLCFAIMIDGKNITNGAYPMEIARKIIMSITEIYKHYKNKKSNITCKEIIQECIMEINRRYGFMMRNEINTYLESRGALNKASDELYPDDVDNVDYDLLDANNALGRRTAPSDRFRSFNTSRNNRTQSLTMFYQAVRRFRQSVEANLLLNTNALNVDEKGNPIDVDISLSGDVDMDEIIRLTKMRLDKATTPEERYMVVLGQLHGVDKFSNVDQNKLLVLHETVVNPLTLLYFVYLILNNYNKFMVAMDLGNLEKAINDLLTAQIAPKGAIIDARGGVANLLAASDLGEFKGTNANNNNSRGNYEKYLAIKLLELNNEKFKSTSAKTEYGLINDNYLRVVEGIDNYTNIVNYFKPAWYVAVPGGGGAGIATVLSNAFYLSPANINTDDIFNEAKFGGAAPYNNEERVAVMKRLFVDRENLMERILTELMNMSCEMNNLVDVYFSGESKLRYPLLNFDRLEEICIATFQQAKQSLSKLRKSLPVNLVEQFEQSRTGDNKDNAVSLFYLQEQLFDRLFKNKYGNGLDDGNDSLKNTWLELTREHKFNWINNNNRACLIEDKEGANKNGWHNEANADNRRSGGTNKNQPGCLPLTLNEYNSSSANNLKSLFREYNYDSYNGAISKLLFWNNENKLYSNKLGFRIMNFTDENQKFPGRFIPIFKNNGCYANPNSRQNTEVALRLPTENVQADAGEINKRIAALNNKVLCPFRGAANSYLLSCGFHNLYNNNMNYSLDTQLVGDSQAFNGVGLSAVPSYKDIGGPDKIAPNTNNDNTKLYLGLLSKFNNIIYNYMNLFIDPSSKKIYRPLIEKFVNGYNSKDILQGKNINDNMIVLSDERAMAVLDANGMTSVTGNIGAGDNTGFGNYRSGVCLFEPPEHSVLFASLASAIRVICNTSTDKVVGSSSLFTEDNFANISEYQKELMRAYLPMFEKHLEMLIKRADFIKNVIDQTSCKVYKWRRYHHTTLDNTMIFDQRNAGDGNIMPLHTRYNSIEELEPTYTQPLKTPLVESESSRKTYLIGMATDIIASAKSLLNCINGVQKELSDIPLFFETYKDSIIDFNNRNQKLPIMPLSILTNLMNFNIHRTNKDGVNRQQIDDRERKTLNDENSAYKMLLLPHNTGIGSDAFKFAYGTRGLLSHKQKPLVDYAPGMSALLDYEKLGGITGGAPKFDKSSVQLLVQNSVLLSRYILDYMYPGQYLGSQNYTNVLKLIVDAQEAIDTNIKNLSCQTSKFLVKNSTDPTFWSNSQNVLMMVENDNVRQSVYRLISCLRENSSNSIFNYDRDKMLLFNILDLNIVPINFHALQREIPFVNIMNYSHTFDHLVKETIGVEFKNQPLTNIHGIMPNAINSNQNDFNIKQMEHTYTDSDYMLINHPEDQLVRYLMYPLGYRRLREYVNHVYKIMAGATSLSLNRPKYLSDQLWNKVLLNNLYNNKYGEVKNNLNQSRRVAEFEQVKSSSIDDNINLIKYVVSRVVSMIDGVVGVVARTVEVKSIELLDAGGINRAAIIAPFTENEAKTAAAAAAVRNIVNLSENEAKTLGRLYQDLFTNDDDLKVDGADFNEIKVDARDFADRFIYSVCNSVMSTYNNIDALKYNSRNEIVQGTLLEIQRLLVDAGGRVNFGDMKEDNLLHSMLKYPEIKDIRLPQDIITDAGIANEVLFGGTEINDLVGVIETYGADSTENPFFNANAAPVASLNAFKTTNITQIGGGAVAAGNRTEAAKRVRNRTLEIIAQKFVNDFNSSNIIPELVRFNLYQKYNDNARKVRLYDTRIALRRQPNHNNNIDNIQETLLSIQNGLVVADRKTNFGDVKENNLLHSLIDGGIYANIRPDRDLTSLVTLNLQTEEAKITAFGDATNNPFSNNNADRVAVPQLSAFKTLLDGGGGGALNRDQRKRINEVLIMIARSILRDLDLIDKLEGTRVHKEIVYDSDNLEPLMSDFINPNFNYTILDNLNYLDSNGKLANISFEAKQLNNLGYQGYLRYNTRLVRWIEWFCNIQRVIRILMRKNLEWVQDPVVNQHDALAEETTEYSPGNLGYRLQDFE